METIQINGHEIVSRKAIREHVPEGSTTIFEGAQRSGKTLGMVIFGLDAFQSGRTVFSNIQLGYPHEPLEFQDIHLEDGQSRFWNGHIEIDELNFYFDARRSMSGPNLEFGAYLLQQKKQGCNITGTTHNLDYLDVRLRQHYDYLIVPTVYPKFPAAPQLLKLTIHNGPLQAYRRPRNLVLDCRRYLGLYDSFAVYDPFKSKKMDEEFPKRRGSRVKLGK